MITTGDGSTVGPPGPGVVLGTRMGPFAGTLTPELLVAYAAATGDPSTRVRSGDAVPPVAIVTQIWDAQTAARAELVPAALQRAASGGVHGEHDIVLHRPIVPGEPLRTWVEGCGSRPAGRNAIVTLRYVTVDAADAVVVEQWWSTVYLGTTCEDVGAPPPAHAVAAGARERPIATIEIEVDPDLARRYAEVSGDWSPHHFDAEAARRSGADRPFLHGLCTMALGAKGVVGVVADGDPDRVRRVAVRFARPMPLGDVLRLRVHAAGPGAFAFEADVGDATVLAHGRLELR